MSERITLPRMSGCPSDAVVTDYVDGRLELEPAREVERHAGSCRDCRELLSVLFVRRSRDAIAPTESDPATGFDESGGAQATVAALVPPLERNRPPEPALALTH